MACTHEPAPRSGRNEVRCEPDSDAIADLSGSLSWAKSRRASSFQGTGAQTTALIPCKPLQTRQIAVSKVCAYGLVLRHAELAGFARGRLNAQHNVLFNCPSVSLAALQKLHQQKRPTAISMMCTAHRPNHRQIASQNGPAGKQRRWSLFGRRISRTAICPDTSQQAADFNIASGLRRRASERCR